MRESFPQHKGKKQKPKLRTPPRMVFADPGGRIYDHPTLHMAAQSGSDKIVGPVDSLIPLPEGSQLFTLPGRHPVGWDPASDAYVPVQEISIDGHRIECTAVAAFLAPGYLRCLLPATLTKQAYPILPLWAYGAVGWKGDRFWASGICIDPNPHWNPKFFQNDQELAHRVQEFQRRYPGNRLLRHLSHCALGYHCFAAKNVFHRRWEFPVPTSPACNAECLGCLSLQPSQDCAASHQRISFVPTVGEIVEALLPHFHEAEDSIASFGQGCEGEPLMQDSLLERAIAILKEKTDRGTININTNGSLPLVVDRLAAAGLDSIRVTLSSPTPKYYNAYHRPRGYRFEDVIESVYRAKARGIYVALNLLVFPGFTDREDEIDSLRRFIVATGADMIQMRNLNIDPDWYLDRMGEQKSRGIGIVRMLDLLKESFPHLTLGYFNQTKEKFSMKSDYPHS